MRRSGRKGADDRFPGVYLLGKKAKENVSDFVLKKDTRRAQSREKRMTCPDFIFEMGARAHKERMAQSCSRDGDEDET